MKLFRFFIIVLCIVLFLSCAFGDAPVSEKNEQKKGKQGTPYEIKPVKNPYQEWISYDYPDILKTSLPNADGIIESVVSTTCELEADDATFENTKIFPTEACFEKCFEKDKEITLEVKEELNHDQTKIKGRANKYQKENKERKNMCMQAKCKLGFVCYFQASRLVQDAIFNILGSGVCRLINTVFTSNSKETSSTAIMRSCRNKNNYRIHLKDDTTKDQDETFIT